MGNNGIAQSIYKTLIYADIFDYPLSPHELWKFLIAKKPISKTVVSKSLLQILFLSERQGLYFLPNRRILITKRLRAQKHSEKKLHIANQVAKTLSNIPTICFIGITGGLAMQNAQKDDDIDFCIIAKKGSLWLTRLITLLVLEFLGKRRKKGQRNVADKICVNMLLDEEGMALKKERQNLYTSHEIAQMLPIFDRDHTYQRFLLANCWVKNFLPNALPGIMNYELGIMKKQKSALFIIHYSLFIIEWVAKKLQMRYMKRNQSVIAGVFDHVLVFFPSDFEKKVLYMYNKKVERYKKNEKIS